jgi:hypothetical protein
MIIHGFAFLKFAKPAHEHRMQVLPTLRKPGSLPFIGTFEKATKPNGFEIIHYFDD